MRRAMAIQLIINREFGLTKNENPLQGSFVVDELTELVEEAVYQEFLAINERGGVLGAMERMYQRSKIQEESMYYETLKHNGDLPIIGVNTFLDPNGSPTVTPGEVIRSTGRPVVPRPLATGDLAMTGTPTQVNWKKFYTQLLVGAVVGGLSAAAVLSTWDDIDRSDPTQLIAIMTGMIYALMGLIAGTGALMPTIGARFLNVEDIEDLRDQRVILGLSSGACVLIGLLFLILGAVPAGGTEAEASRVVVGVLSAGLLALIILTRLTNRRVDELTRAVGLEASSLAMQATLVIFGGWAALAHIGLVAWLGPLGLVSGIALLQLIALFWIGGKRGLMVPEQTV